METVIWNISNGYDNVKIKYINNIQHADSMSAKENLVVIIIIDHYIWHYYDDYYY